MKVLEELKPMEKKLKFMTLLEEQWLKVHTMTETVIMAGM